MEIEGFEDYLIYEDGRVWSKIRQGGGNMFITTTVNKQNDYLCVNLNGKTKTIHRLLGNAFIPNPENKPCIDHIDQNRQNNNISNLRWATYSENNRNRPIEGEVPFRGVSKKRNKFQARARLNGKTVSLGCYNTAEEASEAFNNFMNENKV
tara:strand:+ start:1366 stop:1818 length:453 start_codon:yes stop_codon:yes gene_type:complete